MESQVPLKPHYNISMSRRTRRPMTPKIEPQESFEYDLTHDDKQLVKPKNSKSSEGSVVDDINNIDHKQMSLKQLIKGRCSLARHFKEEEAEEEKQKGRQDVRMVIMRKSSEENQEGVKLKKMVRNYAQVLIRNVIKVKQESYGFRAWRKSAPSLKLMIKDK